MADAVHLVGGGHAHLTVLRALVSSVSGPVVRPWRYRELHNPWSRGSCDVDAWGVLDQCMALGRMPQVGALIGQDVILFDTALLPDRWDRPEQTPLLFPIDPVAGVTILCGIADHSRIDFAGTTLPLTLAAGDIALIPAATDWRIGGGSGDSAAPGLFVARYFPATARYIRDAADPAQLALTERLPLFNFATMPLWLVSGEDRAGNDFVTGFNPRPPYWSAPADLFAL